MVKKYITWNRYWENEHFTRDPDLQIKNLWPQVTFTPLSYYGDRNGDARHLAIIEWTDGDLSADAETRLFKNFSHFTFYEITATKARDLCNEWYDPPEGEEFTLDTDEFTIIDNRTE